MSFFIYNTTGTAIAIDDLGIEVPNNSSYNLESESAHDVAISNDLGTAIGAGDIVVLDPRIASPVYPTNQLSAADGQIVVDSHNDPHYGIRGAGINDLDDVDTSGALAGDVLQLIGGTYTVVPPATIANDIKFGDLLDITDGIVTKPLTDFFILVGDGAGGAVLTDAKTDNAVFIPFIENTVGNVFTGGTYSDITFTYNGATNKVDVAVDDSYLRNDGDELTSGTLSIASGANFIITTGATGTIADAPTQPGHITNKAYVDSVAQGTDNKDSVELATSPAHGDIGGTYNPTGGTGGSGSFTGITNVVLEGEDLTTNQVGMRLIVKDQTDPLQNGIYVISAITASPASVDLERSPDMDGTPVSEVSPGNLAFVERGTVNASTSWIVTGNVDPIVLNTDPVNWTQFSGSGSFTAGRGLNLNGTQFELDINNLQSLAVVTADEIAFNDISDPGITKKRTFTNVIADLGLFTDTNLTASDGVLITNGDIQLDITGLASLTSPSLNAELVFDAGGTGIHNKGTVNDFFDGLNVAHGISTDGLVARTANNTFTSRAIVASILASEEGALVTNGDGVLDNPTIGIDIVGTTVSGNNMAGVDSLLMYNGTNNVSVTGTQIANGVSSILGGLGDAYTTIQGDTGTATASSSSDTLAFLNATNGGIVTLASDGGPDTVTFAINADDLATGTGTVDLTDSLIVSEGIGASNTVKYTFQDMINDLNISTSGSLIGNDGVEVVGNTVSLDFVNLPAQAGGVPAVDPGDIFAIDPIVSDNVNAGTHKKVTFTDLLADLTVVHSLGGNGFAVQTGPDAYSARTMTISSAAGSQGLTLTNGDGVATNPLFGFTITTLLGTGGNLASTNELILYDGTNNVKVTGQQIADGVSSMLGGIGNAYTTITGDTGSATAISSTDTLNFGGAAGGGITTSVTDATPDTVDFTIDFNALIPRATPVTTSMLLGVGEGVAAPTTSRSIGNILTDLGVPNGLGTTPGILVSNGANGYLAVAIAVDGIGGADGLVVTNGNGVLGAPTLGLDITGLPATGTVLVAADELVVNHASGSGANEKITGQNLADGVSAIIGLSGIAVTAINGQQVLTLVDTTRTNKILSVSETEFVWAENRLQNNDWVSIGNARDARTGHIMPMNGTIVRITAQTADDKGVSKNLNLYIDGTLDGVIGSFTGTGGESEIVDTTLDIDFIQGAKLRLRSGGGGLIEDTNISIFVKWRG